MSGFINLSVVFIFLILTIGDINGQDFIAISSNSRTMVLAYNEGKTKVADSIQSNLRRKQKKLLFYRFRFDTYDLVKKEKVFSFRISKETKDELDTIFLSPDGRNLVLIFGFRKIVCDTRSGTIIGDFDQLRFPDIRDKLLIKRVINEKTIAFSNKDNQFVLATDSRLKAFDVFTGTEFFEYTGIPQGGLIEELYFSEDDRFIFAKDHKNNYYVWKTGRRELLKKFIGQEVRYNPYRKTLVIVRKTATNMTSYIYLLPEFKRIERVNSQKTTKADATDKYRLEPGLSSLSPMGRFTAYVLNKDRNYRMVFWNNYQSQIALRISLDATKGIMNCDNNMMTFSGLADKNLPLLMWLNDSLVMVASDVDHYQVFNLASGRHVDQLDLKINTKLKDNESLFISQERNRIISNNKQLVALPYHFFFSKGVWLKLTMLRQQESRVEDVDFYCFTPDSRMILFRDKNRRLAYLTSSDIAADLGVKSLNVKYFIDTISHVAETRIDKKGVIPPDYSYSRMKEIKPLSELRNDLNIKLKTISDQDSFIELQVHLLDDNGVYYFGGGSEEWKKIWCNLIIIGPDGRQLQADDFQIVEYNKNNERDNAISIVMDHSGSMGELRVLALQKGVRDFISSKDRDDALAIIKFDNFVKVESKLRRDPDELLKYFKVSGLMGFGGGTALLDAINAGISNVKDALNYSEKSVMVFTDGNENSSLISKHEVILKALENKIKLHTIGYGDLVSEDYLRAIADYTGGSYYSLYDEFQLKWIFEDVYNKNKNFYGIRIKKGQPGEYRFFVKLCPPVGEPDTLMLSYQYDPLRNIKIYQDENYEFKPLIREIKAKDFDSTGIKFQDIQDFNKITIVRDIFPDTVVLTTDTLDISIIEDEFDHLIFPDIKFFFDKTDIVPGTDRELRNVILFMKKYPSVKLEISGHTDEMGSFAYNQELSEKRAEKVRQLMIIAGIEPERIIVVGYGKTHPVASNKTESGRQANRRVEFRIIEL